MLRRLLVLLTIGFSCISCLSACRDTSNETQPEPDIAKTAADYEAEAKKEVTEENMAEELEKLEKEIGQDISQEP